MEAMLRHPGHQCQRTPCWLLQVVLQEVDHMVLGSLVAVDMVQKRWSPVVGNAFCGLQSPHQWLVDRVPLCKDQVLELEVEVVEVDLMK